MTIELPINLKQEVVVSVQISDIIQAVEQCSVTKQWNLLSILINSLALSQSQLEPQQVKLVKEYLQKKLDQLG
jgi:hypothetical protein